MRLIKNRMKKIAEKLNKKMLGLFLIGALALFLGFSVHSALALDYEENSASGGSYSIPNPLGETTIMGLVTKVMQVLVENVAIPLAVVMIILTGFSFIMAQGDSAKLQAARKRLSGTIIGVAVIILSEATVIFVRNALGDKTAQKSTLLDRVKGALNEIIVVLFLLATVYFAWGVVDMIRGSGDPKKLESGRNHMIWGIIGMAIMAGAWGIITLLKSFLGA